MALGLVTRSAARQPTLVSGTILDSQTTNTNGTWFSMEHTRPFSYTVRGVFNGCTVTVYVSDQIVAPSNSDNNQAVHALFTAPGSNGSDYSFNWIKAAITNAGASTSITVDVQGG